MEFMSLYKLKKILMLPYTLCMGYRYRHTSGFLGKALELHYYRPTFLRFIRAAARQPEILVTADLDADSVVFDVGAYNGEWARQLHDKYGCTIYAFEPNPHSFKKLCESSAGIESIHPMPYGLDAENSEQLLRLKDQGSSVFNYIAAEADMGKAMAQFRTLPEVMTELGVERINLMKINIEGAEFPLLESMLGLDQPRSGPDGQADELLSRIDCLQIQFHEWHPGAYGRYRRIARALRRTHKRTWHFSFVWEQWQRR